MLAIRDPVNKGITMIHLNKKYKILFLLSLLVSGIPESGYCAYFTDRAVAYFTDKAIEDVLSKETSISLYPPGLNIFFCGTGTPYPDEARNPSCLAVVAGSEYLVFDAGDGSSRRLDTMGLPTKELDAVFITHWHSDHFGGLGYLINSSWIFGRAHVLEVYGPTGVTDIVEGIGKSYELDVFYRTSLQEDNLEQEFAFAQPIPVEPGEGYEAKTVVYNKNGVIVSAFLVDHAPVEPALGYMVEYKGRKIVISGDTRISANVKKSSQNADILIHEALNVSMNKNAARIARKINLPDRATQIESIISYHSSTIDIARMAQKANVNKLVLTHLIPGPSNWIAKKMFVGGMDVYFEGDIVIAEDKMHIHLSPKE
ncbi:MBL fold metallo-hydrolase [Endozoicomonas sp.]|uniref:MBL fold metallo-hydrolase n=1 Tax=Endozoicomonas sp. TaxID=1892382 RepID=UPI00383A5E64